MHRAEAMLRQALGDDASLRPDQGDAIRAVLTPRSRLLLVQATGWGKSVVYFLAARCLREEGRGLTLVISPLIALMRNQVEFARRLGLRAEAIHSENREDWDRILEALRQDRIDVLLVSPERLHHADFQQSTLPRLLAGTGLAVIDEAHCVSEWGHDFRPDYRSIFRRIADLPAPASILCTTATATNRVVEDLGQILGPYLEVQRGILARPSLRLVACEVPGRAARMAWLAKYLPRFQGSGIVYTLTVFDAKLVARWLRVQGIPAMAYFAELGADERMKREDAFRSNEVKALVATPALGMGYDKADVGFVVHFQVPSSLIAYYQQIGRAGRAVERAQAVLLHGGEEAAIVESFIQSARPSDAAFGHVAAAFAGEKQRIESLVSKSGVPRSTVRHVIEILEAAEAVQRNPDGSYSLHAARAKAEIGLGEDVRQMRRSEFQAMLDYLHGDRCRMQSVAEALGDPAARPCGICDRCHPLKDLVPDPAKVAEAERYLREEPLRLAPRVQIPLPLLDGKRTLPPNLRNETGRVLGAYGDEGLGQLAKAGKYGSDRFEEALLDAAARVFAEFSPSPTWLTWIPSERRDALPNFAQRLAVKLGIPAVEALRHLDGVQPQKSLGELQEQFANVWHGLQAVGVQQGPVLLLDDIVDSGWTLTIAGLRLRQAGSGPVFPLALAAAGSSRIRLRDEEEPAA